MTFTLGHSRLRSTLVALALCSAALVQAATGYTVTADQQAAVKVGMSRDEVRALLGRPAHNLKYRSEPGRSWTYGVIGLTLSGEHAVFDIEFSADGRVLSTDRRIEQGW